MIPVLVCLLALIGAIQPPPPPAPTVAASRDEARDLLKRAIDAIGGEPALKSITALQLESIGHEFFIDQSERPEGPFVVRYLSTIEQRDVAGLRSRIEVQERFIDAPEWTGNDAVIVDGDAAATLKNARMVPARRQVYDEGRERLELAPERLLFTALDATDLARAPDVKVQGVPQRVVSFRWRSYRARLLLNAYDLIPTSLELKGVDSFSMWGDVTRTTYFSLWTIVAGGVRYPLQTDREWNGVTRASATIVKLTVNPPLEEAFFGIPDDVKKAFAAAPATGFAAAKFDPEKRREILDPGIVQYFGAWNVAFVQQPDGLVIIEAPISSAYSVQVLEEAAGRYPGVRVKALVTTSDAWPHLGGVREYVARGIPIYALDLNQPILERLLKADYSSMPDALAKTPRAPHFTWVSNRTVIGSGERRIELYPARGENGERMMFAYFPARRLLYTSDDIQYVRPGEFFMPEYLAEVRDAVAREHLQVDRVFGMHIGSLTWSEIEAAIDKASAR
jgi:hypothetical protein